MDGKIRVKDQEQLSLINSLSPTRFNLSLIVCLFLNKSNRKEKMLLGGLKQFCNCNGSDKIKVLGTEIRKVFEVEVSEMLFVRDARESLPARLQLCSGA